MAPPGNGYANRTGGTAKTSAVNTTATIAAVATGVAAATPGPAPELRSINAFRPRTCTRCARMLAEFARRCHHGVRVVRRGWETGLLRVFGGRTMRARKLMTLVAVWSLLAGTFATIAATPASAADKLTTSQDVSTKMRCRASAPIVGWVDADQDVGLNVTFPQYVKQGDTFEVVTLSGETEVPLEESGITVINLSNIFTRTRFQGGFTIESVTPVPGTGSWRSSASADPVAIPGGVSTTIDGGNNVVLSMPGPFAPGGILVPPKLSTVVRATGAVGTKITSTFAGSIPTNLNQAFPDYGFKTTAHVNAPIVGASDAAASCAPNYGPLANGNGELAGTQPRCSATRRSSRTTTRSSRSPPRPTVPGTCPTPTCTSTTRAPRRCTNSCHATRPHRRAPSSTSPSSA